MLETIASLVGIVPAAAACIYALAIGGKPERVVAAAMVVAMVASAVAVGQRNTLDPHWGVFWVDLALLALLVWVVIRTSMPWVYVAAATHLIGTLSHGVAALDPRIFIKTYVSLSVAASYVALAALVWGATQHHLKRLNLKR